MCKIDQEAKFHSLERRVIEICGAWGLYEQSDKRKQMLYALSEAGELAKAIAKCDPLEVADAIGDTLVCVINAYHLSSANNSYAQQVSNSAWEDDEQWGIDRLLDELFMDLTAGVQRGLPRISIKFELEELAKLYGFSLNECLALAVDTIAKRKGKMINGVFVKNETNS